MLIFMKSYAFMNFEIANKQHISSFTYFLSLYKLLFIIVFSSAYVFNFPVKYTFPLLTLCILHLIYIQYRYSYQMHFIKGNPVEKLSFQNNQYCYQLSVFL